MLALALLPACTEQRKVPLDLATRGALAPTCAALPARPTELGTDVQRIAYAVCRDITLVKRIATFLKKAEEHEWGREMPPGEVIRLVRAELDHARREIGLSRRALEDAAKGRDPVMMLAPGSWQVDLDSNGTVDVWEKHFFAIPRADRSPLAFRIPSEDPEYYVTAYNLDARIRADKADVLWALGYHYFFESLLEMILAYTLQDFRLQRAIRQVDAGALLRARELMVKGLHTSERMRLAVLAEKDDRDEWLANPKQKNTVSPVRLDSRDFAIWGQLLGHLIPLFEGRTLIESRYPNGSFEEEFNRFCRLGEGLDMTLFFSRAPRELPDSLRLVNPDTMCRPVSAAQPSSGLPSFLAEYEARAKVDPGVAMGLLKQLVWVN